jgi:hypothetical protein
VNEAEKRLRQLVCEVPRKWATWSEEELHERRLPHQWSRKEILGHLCDSAINNISRFVRATFEAEPIRIPKYAQNEWVNAQGYGRIPSGQIIGLWSSLNEQAASVISGLSDVQLTKVCIIGDDAPVTLQFIVDDYVRHQEHHLRQIFSD